MKNIFSTTSKTKQLSTNCFRGKEKLARALVWLADGIEAPKIKVN